MDYKQAFYRIVKALDVNGFHQHATSIRVQAERSLTDQQARAVIEGALEGIGKVAGFTGPYRPLDGPRGETEGALPEAPAATEGQDAPVPETT